MNDSTVRLKQLAEAATPGPWRATGNLPFYATLEKPARSLSKHDDKRPDYWRVQDVEFVLAANPEVVLGLIARIEKLEAALEEILYCFPNNYKIRVTEIAREALKEETL